MKIIDFHTHIYPPEIAAKATESICEFYSLNTEFTGTAESLLARGKEAGISEFVLLPVANKPEQVRHINEFIVGEVKKHPEFFGFGTLHADMEDFNSEIDYIEASGLKGIKLHPDSQKFPIDDERLFPAYERLEGRLPVLIHCGDKRFDFSHPRRLVHVLNEFPKLQVIAAHLGGWSIFEEGYALLKNKNCYFDISSCMAFIPPKKMVEYIRGYGAERLLFGTDFPLWDPVKEVEAFLSLPLRSDEQEKIAFHNAEKILGLTK
ncbi:MAG: amidohydrolase family protein [Catonella sp.]|nr:amidohydrolase family protein [Catonella sp.]MDY6356096.1 amidohydrolase family protein [Catonella sp.]